MARPIKYGIDYFPFDVSFFSDRKIKRLRAKYGNDGVMVYIYLLCEVYNNGYYIDYDDDLILDISDELNISENSTMQIMNYLLSRSLFDDTLAKSVKVLTAKSIQRRYQEIVEERAKKRVSKCIEVDAKFWVLNEEETRSFIKVRPVNDTPMKKSVFPENNSIILGKNTTKESKVNESKVKESRGNENSFAASAPPTLRSYGEFGHIWLTYEQYQKLVLQYGESNIKSYIRKMDDWLEANHKTYDNCFIKLRQWLDKDGVKKEFSDGFDPDKYKALINNI